ncbi:Multidrug resistance protein ABC transporter family protein [Quillaja saponaria]|uniref:Multidrug resistance protein ABC transporter family protein n=1 Tax=Quillaja saponaria TaxID=32244 RepID=A0AAD7VIY3_QUISA|nr:Multidrug resistance protein ABC transporter family protein [Quillaja saponaria]
MGNTIKYLASKSSTKIVLWDGSVQEFDNPVTVAELMLEHPQQVVVEFHSAMNQKRPSPLPADKKLEMNKIYLMIPMKRGKPAGLTTEEARRILLIVNSLIRSQFALSSSKYLPLFARMCPAAGMITEPDKCVIQKKEKTEKEAERYVNFSDFLPEMMEETPEYLSRQLSGKGWKPSLDTIKEKKVDKRITHWLF